MSPIHKSLVRVSCVYVCMTFIAPSPVKSTVSRDRISSNRSDTYAPIRHSPSDSYTVRPPEPGGTVTCPICHSQLLSSLHRRGSAKHTPASCVSCLLPLTSLQTRSVVSNSGLLTFSRSRNTPCLLRIQPSAGLHSKNDLGQRF